MRTTAQDLTSKIVAYCTSRALVIHPAERALVADYNLIMQPLNYTRAKAIVEYCEFNGHTLGGWLPSLRALVAELAPTNLAPRFLDRQQFIRDLAEVLQIGTDVNGSLVLDNEAKAEAFFDQLAQYDAD